MKLVAVWFKRQVHVPGHGFSAEWAASNEVTLEYDHSCDMVAVNGIEFPRSDVDRWQRNRAKDTDKVTCPDCARQFNNKRALGSHRRFKHEDAA